MARRNRDNESSRSSRRRPQLKRRHFLGLVMLTVLLLGLVCLPRIVTTPWVLVSLIDRYGGLAPLKVELEQVDAGWFAPVQAGGIRLLDGQGQLLARIEKATTEKGILAWVTGSSDLGTIRIEGMEAAVVVQDGKSNLETALEPLLLGADAEEKPDASSSSLPGSGTIEIVDSKVLLMEANRSEQWVVAVPQMSVTLPGPSQVIGPIEFKAAIAETSGTIAEGTGSIAADVKQTDGTGAFAVRAKMNSVPVDFWHVVHARFPEIPIVELHGRLSATLAGSLVDAQQWSFDVQQFESQDLSIDAPELLGENPAEVALVSAAGRATLADSKIQLENAQLQCDFGSASAQATLPWPIEVPTATNPFVPGATFHAQGSVDLPKLTTAAKTLLPMRDGTTLLAGTGQFVLSQQFGDRGTTTSSATLQLGGLQAMAAGQRLSWDEPLAIEMTLGQTGQGVEFGARCTAEFCRVQGGGTLESGQLSGNLNLDLLQQRVSQWVELPIRTMTGSADASVTWQLVADDLVRTQGTLTTTPLAISSAAGGQHEEPAWNGTLDATARLANGGPERIENAQLILTSTSEKLTFELQEPLALIQSQGGVSDTPPAGFHFNLEGSLANWQRRGTLWLAEPPELQMRGNLNLAVGGRVDMQHIEVLQANWNSQPMEIATPQMQLSEAQMIGNFKGRVDTSDLTRLMVDNLQVQSTSFSLSALDSAAADGSGGRVGRAMFLVDLDRLMKNMNSGASARQFAAATVEPGVAAAKPTSQMSATGRVTGELNWQVAAASAQASMKATGEQLVLLIRDAAAAGPRPLWNEPSVTAALSGHWTAENNSVDVEQVQFQMPWMNYSGNLIYRTQGDQQSIQLKGQAVYDSAQLASKLGPLTGGQIELVGQQTVPIDVQWIGNGGDTASALSGLRTSTRVGWEQARMAGISVGKADVPVLVTDGQLASTAEIPVSGGTLRWDILSDLTAPELIITQKPMTVLENVEITEEMCQGWLKYVTPLLAEATSVDGRLSLTLSQASLNPTNPRRQTVMGQLVIHDAEVGPGPLSNQVITLFRQIEAIRKQDFTQAVSSQKVWLRMPEQRIDFQMVDGNVSHRDLRVRVGDAVISTAGTVNVDGQMELLATMPIPDDWVEKSPLLAGMRGQSLQFPMRGTLSSPQVDTRLLQQFGRQTVEGAARGLLQQGLSRGLEKLFGAPPVQPPAGGSPSGN